MFEDGSYHVVRDSAHEEVTGEGEKDNIHALGLVKMLFTGIIKMGKDLGEKKEALEKWEHIAKIWRLFLQASVMENPFFYTTEMHMNGGTLMGHL